jgi:hypothetical protein
MHLFTSPNALTMLSLPLVLAAGAMAAPMSYARLMLQFFNFWPGGPAQDMLGLLDDDVKVPVTLGVMSQCPDALICEATMDKVLNQVGDKIELSLSFIG